MSKKNGTKSTKEMFPKTIYVENYGTRKHPDVTATHDLENLMYNIDMNGGKSDKPLTIARYELVEVGVLETTTKFKVTD